MFERHGTKGGALFANCLFNKKASGTGVRLATGNKKPPNGAGGLGDTTRVSKTPVTDKGNLTRNGTFCKVSANSPSLAGEATHGKKTQ
jgi:hypothetical protein